MILIILTISNTYFTIIDKLSEKKLQLVCQNNIIKEYESWTHLLLNIINNTKTNPNEKNFTHIDYGTPVQKHLEKLTKIELECFDIQKKIIQQHETIKTKETQLNDVSSKLDIINEDLYENNAEKTIEENMRLVDNIDIITEELDYLTLCNKNFNNILDNDSKTILGLMETIKQLEKENEMLNEIDNLVYNDIFKDEDSGVKVNTEFNIFHNNHVGGNKGTGGINSKKDNSVFNYDLNSLSCFSNNNVNDINNIES